MKPIHVPALLWLCLCFFVQSCTSNNSEKAAMTAPTLPEPDMKTCKCTVKFLTNNGNNIYVDVEGFDPKNKDCFGYLRQYGQSRTAAINSATTVHFFDNLPNFTPPESGMYGGGSVRKKVILQYIRMPGGADLVSFDPFGLGRYVEI